MPRLRHFYGEGHYHYLTENIYRRARIFDSDRCKRKFVQTLGDLRAELSFKIFAYVLMPESVATVNALLWAFCIEGRTHTEAVWLPSSTLTVSRLTAKSKPRTLCPWQKDRLRRR